MALNQPARRLKPAAKLKLIQYQGTWSIGYKATGSLEGTPGKILAWLKADDHTFICAADADDLRTYDLPETEKTNFFGDQFTFAVDETNDKGEKIQRLAGANNVEAANAAFHAALKFMPPQRYILLRQGARVLMRGHDLRVIDDAKP